MKRKINIFLALFLSIVSAICLFACGGKDKSQLECTLVESTETRVVISVTNEGKNCTLLDCMEILKGEDFTYEVSSGMVTSINGVTNPADYSKCWMLYTSDAEMANTAWGTTEYDGETLGSAIVGADALEVLTGCIYVWEYRSFDYITGAGTR